MSCSFSPQISDSNADPPAAKWHTTVDPQRLAEAGVGEPVDQPLADADLRASGLRAVARDDRNVGTDVPDPLAHAPHHDVGQGGGIALTRQRDQDVDLGAQQRPPVATGRDVR
jgi:hypothetical protein